MRIHTLTLRSIGPFADEQVIDFDRLGAGGLFLLEGPTGVGKSTVLDAITFALYGGSAAVSGRMVSHFAGPRDVPQVILELSVRDRRLRLTRSPQFERPKVHGTGTTQQKSAAHLQELVEGTWTSVSTGQDEIGALVTDWLGLTREQFRQVVLLPQGEFARFLRADVDTRQAVLGRLFSTQFYDAITAAIQGRASAGARARTAAEGVLRERLAAAWEAAGRGPEEDESPQELSFAQQVSDVASVHGRRLEEAQSAVANRLARQREEERLRGVATEAGGLADLVGRREAVVAGLAAAQAQAPEQADRVARLAHARRAAPVRPLIELFSAAQEAWDLSRKRLADSGLAEHAQLPAQHAGVLRAEASAALASAAGLAHVVAIEASLVGERDEAASARERSAQAHRSFTKAVARAAELPGQTSALREALAVAQEQQRAAQEASQGLDGARRRLAAAQAVDRAASALRGLEQTVVGARAVRVAADEAAEAAIERRLAGARAELVGLLAEGEPCLICGSREHPAPAQVDEGAGVTEAKVRALLTAQKQAVAALEEAERVLAEAQRELAAHEAVAAGADVAAAVEAVAQGEAAAADRQAAEKLVGSLTAEIDGLVTLSETLAGQRVELAQAAATAESRAEEAGTRLADREAKVADARGDHASVAHRSTALRSAAERANGDAHLLEQHALRSTELATAEVRAQGAAAEAGFGDLDAARSAVLAPVELTALEEEVSAWQKQVDALTEQLRDPRLEQVRDFTPEQMSAVTTAVDGLGAQAAQATKDAESRATVAERIAERLGERLDDVREAEAQRLRIDADIQDVLDLDLYCRGMAGRTRMTLTGFVLRFWFDQVVRAANVRLQVMSTGKYELLRVEAPARKGARIGLGLAILDRHTGKERGTETLSGGETFYTSLSLALGLADVVVAQAGGAQLDTLFIDEGFGSLDPDTLDEVMGVIDELRGYGRVVGIVSHVTDLKERVPERLAIRRTRPDGPSQVEVLA